MNASMDPLFTASLRAALIEQVRAEDRRRKRRGWRIGGALAGVVLAGTGAAAVATNVSTPPGADRVKILRAGEPLTGKGTTSIDLGAAPKGTTHIELTFSCLSVATYSFEDGTALTCEDSDFERRVPVMSQSIPVRPGESRLSVTTVPEARWRLTASYSTRTRTKLGVNADGKTYGVVKDGAKDPDLVAVIATNGRVGYAYSQDLEGPEPSSPEEALRWQKENEGKRRFVPVYTSDGHTVIGRFALG